MYTGSDVLTEEDRDNIRAFQLKMEGNMPRRVFNQMRRAFQHKMTIDSEWVIIHRLAILSGIEPIKIHCCIKSCIAYTGQYEFLQSCPFCNEARFGTGERPRRIFSYLPLIPRLQAFFQNPYKINQLTYRAKFHHVPGRIGDVFDGQLYRDLLAKPVIVDGIHRPYNHFSNPHDIALSLCSDSYLLYKRRRGGPSATPILIQILNLPPLIRTHLEHLMCLGVIPGPHQPKDLASFLTLFEDECAELALGVPTFNFLDNTEFDLHAYLVFQTGDIVAMEKLLNIRGHNGYSPCRSCSMKGVRNVTEGGTIYYIPLTTPNLPHQSRPSMDPRSLPLRHHNDFITTAKRMAAAQTAKKREKIGKYHGIRGEPILGCRVNTIDHANSSPWDCMHLFFENDIPNMVSLWTGRFKGLDSGTEDYEIAPNVWEEIGAETAEAVKDIPAAFVRVLGNIAEDRSTFTAESWAFWFIYLAPILLKDRFHHVKYYKHACLLAKILKRMLKLDLTLVEIDELEDEVIDWVELFEKYAFSPSNMYVVHLNMIYTRYYYQYNEGRLSTCTLTIHGVLHVPKDIRKCGPVWTTWTFSMERFCGFLQAGLRSKTHPWSNLDKRVLHLAYISQLHMRYDLEEIGTLKLHGNETLSRNERIYDDCKCNLLSVDILSPSHL